MEGMIGEIRLFAGNFAPRSWMFCQGQLLAIASNQALFSILGTTYGGDGRTTFALPDLRGRAPIGTGNGPGLSPTALGARGGHETVTLTQSEMPSHSHGISHTLTFAQPATTSPSDSVQPGPTAKPGQVSMPAYSNAVATTTLEPGSIGGAVTAQNAGGSQSHTNMQPYIGLNYIIAVQGIFPSRG